MHGLYSLPGLSGLPWSQLEHCAVHAVLPPVRQACMTHRFNTAAYKLLFGDGTTTCVYYHLIAHDMEVPYHGMYFIVTMQTATGVVIGHSPSLITQCCLQLPWPEAVAHSWGRETAPLAAVVAAC